MPSCNLHNKLSIYLYLILSFDPKIKEKPTLTPSSLNIQHKIFRELGYYPFFQSLASENSEKGSHRASGKDKINLF